MDTLKPTKSVVFSYQGVQILKINLYGKAPFGNITN